MSETFPAPPTHSRAIWLVVLTVLAGLITAGSVAALGAIGGPTPVIASPPDSPRREATTPTRSDAAPDDVLELAGSGSNLPLTRRLADNFERRERREGRGRGSPRVVVHESIGSTGGVRALVDGVIDLALISRPLRRREQALGVRTVPYAQTAVVLAAHPSVSETNLTGADVIDLYAGRRRRWANGEPVVVMQRERGDSSHRVVAAHLDGFGAADEASRQARRFEVVYSDRDMQEALLSIEHSVGLLDLGAIRVQALPLRVVAIDGVTPTPEHVADGSYPFVKPLVLVYQGELAPLAARFVDFVVSEEGRRIIIESGYLLPGDEGGP